MTESEQALGCIEGIVEKFLVQAMVDDVNEANSLTCADERLCK
jgi:hypothetical protein